MKKEKKIITIVILLILIAALVRVVLPMTGGDKPSGDSVGKKDTTGEKQYDSIEAAMQNADIAIGSGDEYQKTITQEIFRIENKDYATVYYRSQKNEQEECLTLAQFRIIDDGQKKYQFISCIPSKVEVGDMKNKDGIDLVRLNLTGLDVIKSMGVDPESKTFMCGQNGDTNIKNLQIDGQSPDGIIPFTVIGKQRYFWYYEDLATDNPAEAMVITMGD